MTKAQRTKKLLAAFDARDLEILGTLAAKLNARPQRLRIATKLDLAARYLRRHCGTFPWHKGGHHVGRHDFGPMLAERGGIFTAEARL